MFGAYSCRGIDNMPGARLSEHAFGNAVDVAGFTLADGRRIDFVHDWKSAGTQEAAFLHEAHAGACQYFTTVLGPARMCSTTNHIHLDLANHGSTDTGPRRICKPTPAPDLLPAPAAPDGLPPAPELDEPLDIAHLSAPAAAPPPADASSGPGDGPDVALPPAPIGASNPLAYPAGRRRSKRRSEPDLVDPPPRRLGIALAWRRGRGRVGWRTSFQAVTASRRETIRHARPRLRP